LIFYKYFKNRIKKLSFSVSKNSKQLFDLRVAATCAPADGRKKGWEMLRSQP
jgi:hypothetical protein